MYVIGGVADEDYRGEKEINHIRKEYLRTEKKCLVTITDINFQNSNNNELIKKKTIFNEIENIFLKNDIF